MNISPNTKPVQTSHVCWACMLVWLVGAPLSALLVVWLIASILEAIPWN
jgi:hypothetical protein